MLGDVPVPPRFLCLFASLAAASPALGAPPIAAVALGAVRRSGAIVVDGRPDEPAWAGAPSFDAFVELYPREGAAPRRRTEVRLVHDEGTLYVAFWCEGERPDEVARPLGRRDHIPSGSDSVAIALDAAHDRRTAYFFAVSAGGVLEDRLLYDDTEETSDWDAVWDGAVAPTPTGWTAELAIPFSALRFTQGRGEPFGVYLERKVGRTHEILASSLIPLGAGAFVSRFSDLALGPIGSAGGVELAPFVVTRLAVRPVRGVGVAGPQVTDPSGDLGLDLAAPIGSRLGLAATVNPDFGQVEADPVILNLTRFEPFFPEKRPFFQRDLDLFQPVGGPSGEVPQQIVYTRRIGLDAPILGAAKLTGEVAPGVSVSALDAVVMSGRASPGDRGVRFHLAQPLHLAPEDAYPASAPAPENFFAAALRLGSSRTSFFGLQAALATPVAPACTEAAAAADAPPPECAARGGAAAAALFALRSRGSEYGLVGQIALSRSLGGPPSRVLPDGTPLRRGDLGWGAYFTGGKMGGEPIRATVSFELASPRLDLNAVGFQPDQNVMTVRPELRFVRRAGLGALHEISLGASASLQISTDARRLDRGRTLRGDARVVLPGFHEVACDGGYETQREDPREIVATGIPYRRPASFDVGCSFGTDPNRAFAVAVSGGVNGTPASAPLPATLGWVARADLVSRPHPRAETRLTFQAEGDEIPGRFVEQDDPDVLFADLSAVTLSLKLRQQLVLTRRLALIGYLQLFADSQRFGPYYSAPASPSGIRPGDLLPAAPPDGRPDVAQASLRANVVLSWEYRLGSTLYVVYSRESQDAAVPVAGEAPRLGLGRVGRGPSTDVFLVKWSYRFVR